ncbi:hypothetical protein ATP_00409 [Candidatus Phytoplasma mali]|uniref:Uncharacterized protein n=1 Tax=Phytoplasma mali (strain AT) TaxID=482235 RepID=B3QZI9_PHYMT|nr:hypothetical protein [Candidatus Phytoplasma mali]CAP18596.1 hypothetical protein ATP_00409 [Candidatus Phytoplasma mali]
MKNDELLKNEVFIKKMKDYIEFEKTLNSLDGGDRGFESLLETLYETKMNMSDTFCDFIGDLDAKLREFEIIIEAKKAMLEELIKEEYKLDDDRFEDLYEEIL